MNQDVKPAAAGVAAVSPSPDIEVALNDLRSDVHMMHSPRHGLTVNDPCDHPVCARLALLVAAPVVPPEPTPVGEYYASAIEELARDHIANPGKMISVEAVEALKRELYGTLRTAFMEEWLWPEVKAAISDIVDAAVKEPTK